MLIHNALLTGSITLNGSDVSNITGSADYSASFSSRITNNEATGSTLTAASSSFSTRVTGLEASSGSFSTRTTSLEAASSSFSTRTTAIERVYATTGSNTFTAAQVIQGTLTAQTLIVQTVTSSVLFSTGSNRLGNSLSNVQELTGSVGITGSLSVITNGTEFQVNAGGVNIGNALTDSHIISGSVTINPNGLFVSSSGNVGINNVSPMVAFDVVGATKITGVLTLTSTISNGTYAYTLPSATGTLALTSALSGYLPLTGGTLTGALAGTSANFSGNVGIGTTSPATLLEVKSSTTFTEIKNTNTASGGYALYQAKSNASANIWQFGSWNDGTYRVGLSGVGDFMTITSGGNVGIGTSSPQNTLDVQTSSGVGSSTASALARFISASTTPVISVGQANSARRLDIYTQNIIVTGEQFSIQTASAQPILFETNGPNERMRITSGGNVLIGTSTLGTATGTTDLLTIGKSGSSSTGINFTDGTSTRWGFIYISNAKTVYGSFTDTAFETGVSATERMRITSAGNVGINTTTPGYKLEVIGDFKSGTSYLGSTTFFTTAVNGPQNYGGNTIRIVGSTGASAAGIQFGPADSNATGARGRIGFLASANNGNPKEFAIIKGVLDSTGPNTCNGSLTFHTLNGDNATEASTRMTIDGNGSIGAPSGTNIYNASDIRLKQNISSINNGLNSILALNPVKFNWINNFVESENEKDMLGFIAQEVQEIIPEAVESFGGNSITIGDTTINNPLRVNEKFIIPILVKAIQELSAQASEQQTQINELKALLNSTT